MAQLKKHYKLILIILIFPVGKETGFYLQALNLQTGAPLWTYTPISKPPKNRFDYTRGARFQIRKNRLYIDYQPEYRSSSLVMLDVHTGKELLKQKPRVDRESDNLAFYDSHLFLKLYPELQLIDTTAGQVSADYDCGMPWNYKNKLLVITNERRLMELEPGKADLKPFRPFAGKTFDRFSPFLGIYKDRIIQHKWNYERDHTSLFAYSLETGGSRKLLNFPKNLRIGWEALLSGIRSWNLNAFPYHNIPGRFLPVFASHSEKRSGLLRLYILDLKHNKIVWQSKIYEGIAFHGSNMVLFTKNGYYFLELTLKPANDAPDHEEHKSLLILDAKTGKFKEPLNFGEGRRIYERHHRPSLTRNNIFYGQAKSAGKYWSYDLRTMLPAFPDSDAVTLTSARKFVEAQLGPLPR